MFHASLKLVAVLLLCLASGALAQVQPAKPAARQLLHNADRLKTTDYATFAQTLERLAGHRADLSRKERDYLLYLGGWNLAYQGDYTAALVVLQDLGEQALEPAIRLRARATVVNVLQIASRYEDALTALHDLFEQLPKISDAQVRQQILGVASLLYSDVGAYELALKYAHLFFQEADLPAAQCRAKLAMLKAIVLGGAESVTDEQLQEGIELCLGAGSELVANAIRALWAQRLLDSGEVNGAVSLLAGFQDEVRASKYPELIGKSASLLALAYWLNGDLEKAARMAQEAVQPGRLDRGTKSLVRASQVLYLVAKQRGDSAAALAWHERYMAADTAYLNEVSAKALVFQKVNQQVLAKQHEIDALNDRNRILGLQQELAAKAAETTRLYAGLLILILAAVAWWAWRTKRSQVAFRKQARRDSLTGIFNRQHFMDAARATLQYGSKSDRECCLILLDLDHFKQVNDMHGHATGDTVLKRVVAACQQQLRSVDLFGRLGGEEFGVLLPDCGLDEGAQRAEQMRRAIAGLASDDMPQVSASFGVSSTAEGGNDLRQLLADADAALYRAKRAGRNAVVKSAAAPGQNAQRESA